MFANPNFPEDSFFNKYCSQPPSWFEFMLDETGSKLRTHLHKNYEPNAANLISMFVDKASSHITNTEGAVRQYSSALWNIAAEAASYLRWDHKVLEEIPTPIRQKLLSHLVKITVPADVRAQDIGALNFSDIPKEGLTALFLYHRWICTAFVHLHFYKKTFKKEFPAGFVHNITALQLIEPELSHSMEFLQKMTVTPTEMVIPQVFSFSKQLPSHQNNVHVSAATSAAQAHFDLGELLFYYSSHTEAYAHFKNAENLLDKATPGFLSFTKQKVMSYLVGLQFLTGSADIIDHSSLLSKLELTKASNYEGCVEILLDDNYKRELSYCHRRNFVKEVHESCKDQALHKQAYLCNVLLEVLLGRGSSQLFWDMLKGDKDLVLDFVISATVIYLDNNVSKGAKQNLRLFFLSIISKRYMKNRVEDVVSRVGLLLNISLPKTTPGTLAITKTKMLRNGELSEYYDTLASCNSFTIIKDTISRICQIQPNFHYQTVCDRIFKDVRKVALFLPLTEALACPRPLAYMLIYKIAHLYHYKQNETALKLIREIKDYLKTAQYAAFKRAHNSRMLDQLDVILNAFILNRSATVSHHRIKPSEGFMESIEVLNGSHHPNNGNQSLSIDTSIASAVLLNLDRQPTILDINDGFDFIAGQLWSFIQNPEFDLTTLFKLLIPMHSLKPPEGSMTRSMLVDFCKMIIDERTLELLVAVLVKIYNQTEKPELHNISCDIVTAGWPKVSNTKEADVTMCLSTLTRVLDHALAVHPHNLKLLTISANCKMYTGDNEGTIRQLLSCGALISDGFTNLQILDRWLDSSFYNLVKACMNINAHVEVALLCCMKSPPDYGTSFQALKRVSDHHSLHVYYPLFWDTNLLECAIAQHHKRGETLLRDFVIGLMGQPELNVNNPPILLRRTHVAKKCAFLRTLFHRFLLK